MAVDTNDGRPTGYWLQVDGCPNGSSWVELEYIDDDSMLLGREWKAFACSHHLTQGQYLAFEYDGDETLSVKIFRTDGGHEDCCAESAVIAATTRRTRMKMMKTPSTSRPRGARFPEDARGGTYAAAPKMSVTSFLAASSTYIWK